MVSHVQIPPFSRFSKYFHYWRYKCRMESRTNVEAKTQMKALWGHCSCWIFDIKWRKDKIIGCSRGPL